MNDADFMNLALIQAKSASNEVPVGAVIVFEGRVVAQAYNEQESLQDALAHAEMLAISRAQKALQTSRLSGCTLYVTLEPCPMCAGAIILSGIKRCVFAAFDQQYGCCGSVYALPMDPVFNHRVLCEGGLMAKESEALLDAFFKVLRADKG
ncbi:MAG: nucleoside deaminase [Bacillota bacterium]|nr:nucleoside deaminase [Bacillota bacterium]